MKVFKHLLKAFHSDLFTGAGMSMNSTHEVKHQLQSVDKVMQPILAAHYKAVRNWIKNISNRHNPWSKIVFCIAFSGRTGYENENWFPGLWNRKKSRISKVCTDIVKILIKIIFLCCQEEVCMHEIFWSL